MKIQSKILIMVTAICFIALISISILSYVAIRRISDYTMNVSASFGDDAKKAQEAR